MEISSFRGFSEMGFDNSQIFNQWQTPPFDEFNILPLASALGEHIYSSFPQPTVNFEASAEDSSSFSISTLAKQPKASGRASVKVDPMLNNQVITSPYVNSDSSNQQFSGKLKDNNYPSKKTCLGGRWARTSCGRFPQTHDHIMAERKRREKLSQRFIALSALIPGLSKMDKASVLGDAVKYLKQLQERVKVLEEQSGQRAAKAIVSVKKLRVCDNGLDNGDSSNTPFDEPLSEIEVRVSNRNVLVRVHCQKTDGVLEMIVAEVQTLLGRCHPCRSDESRVQLVHQRSRKEPSLGFQPILVTSTSYKLSLNTDPSLFFIFFAAISVYKRLAMTLHRSLTDEFTTERICCKNFCRWVISGSFSHGMVAIDHHAR